MKESPKVMAISCSHRNNANTEQMLVACLSELKKRGVSFELVALRKLDMKTCDACSECEKDNLCRMNDDLQKIYPKLLNAKVWIVATPEYWMNVSGLCKNFLDRLTPYWMERKKHFAKKKAAIITCGGQPKKRIGHAEKYLRLFFSKLHMKVIGSVLTSAEEPKEVLAQAKTLRECRNLGKKIADSLRKESYG